MPCLWRRDPTGVLAVYDKAVATGGRLPFVFEASGSETHFTNGYDPNPRARRIFAFPQPATLARTLRDADADPERPTWRGKVTAMPALDGRVGGSFTVGGLDVLWPKKARKIITAPGTLDDDRLQLLHRHLAAEFPPA